MDCTNEDSPTMSSLQQDFPGYSTIIGQQYPLKPLLPLFSDTTRTNDLSNGNAAMDFTWRMESELEKAIRDQYLSANTVLKSLLFTQSRLQWHLRGMSEFFFMMQGEVMHLFAASVFSKVPYQTLLDKMIKRSLEFSHEKVTNSRVFFDTTDETQAALA